ncbi:hypothetical protein LIER_36073 [Lithospermum erythrorhizon]|uniref:Uncharacterized protein n=1 Tax=Lithospermum erythrorhizon TaxID=34254 RepID=A0AAV3P552_LITER
MERGLPRRRVHNNSIATLPTNNIPLLDYPCNIPPLNTPHPYHYSYASYQGNVPYNPPFNVPIGFRTGPMIQRPLMNEPIFEYQNPWLGISDPSLGHVFGSTSRTYGAGSSTHNTLREASRQERFVQRDEDDQEKDEFGLDLTLKL